RVATSHLRVGTFEYVSKWGTVEDLQTLADYTLNRHFTDLETGENKYLALLKEVIKRQAELVAQWQLVGFIHGVMNTDNMTISGESIDYGPCAFMDTYDPSTVFSSIDIQGRYAYGNQPVVARWNLARFAESLLPLLHDHQEKAIELAKEQITNFTEVFQNYWLSGMRAKLGIFNQEADDTILVHDLLEIMKKYEEDYTNTFLALTFNDLDLLKHDEFVKWHHTWQARLGRQQESKASSIELMKSNNPAIIPRNHRVEEALEAAVEKS